MNDYISRDVAVAVAEKYGLGRGCILGSHSGIADCIASEIESIPPAVDAVPVVRCLDCKHYGYDALGYKVCNAAVGLVYPEDDSYCSYGQRKDHMDGGKDGTNH